MPQHTHNHELESQTYYDKVAPRFDKSWDGFLSGFFKRYILKNLNLAERAVVLDVGCANGKLLSMLHEKRPIWGTGLDISPVMIEQAKKERPEFNFFQGSAEALPFPDQSFDLLICSASFHHFANPDQFLEEAKRVLRPQGRLFIAEIHIPFVTKPYNSYVNRFSQEGDVKVYKPKELVQLAKAAGFVILSQKYQFQIQALELLKPKEISEPRGRG